MQRVASSFLFFVFVVAGGILWAQDDSSLAATATCNFDEEKQLVVQYQRVTFNLKKSLAGQIPFGKVWSPGGKPMTLFTNTPLSIDSKLLPIGAYTLFVIPNTKQWTLIVSKSTDTSGAYDEDQDLVRLPLESGELLSPEPDFAVSFAHVAPQQCNIRIDLDKTGHFGVILQK